MSNDDHDITDLDALRALYGWPGETSLAKESDHVHPLYAPYIEAAPFAVLATHGPRGLDVSPRGDGPGFVQIADPKTLLLPDRRGNKRVDSLCNVLHDPDVALLFLIPGVPEALRVNGRARISTAPALLERCAHEGILPLSVLVIEVALVFFQCARAVKRAGLWDAASQIDRGQLPSPGLILQTLSAEGIDGVVYDAELQERQRRTMY
ncbi:pyridoxamine 5'-phosphate oxidase family protein [Pelomonas sp. KK5]|uniref:pyridoxamine 5'-phosphate oxidase family protein n=1 Tax=Pelomonas sp. KK5 TaxID=1855730 RepID=UPI00097BAD01|nr:pyridoxamine 5'-phosphate oxidase family protein [Pelomonas sp. KK5]